MDERRKHLWITWLILIAFSISSCRFGGGKSLATSTVAAETPSKTTEMAASQPYPDPLNGGVNGDISTPPLGYPPPGQQFSSPTFTSSVPYPGPESTAEAGESTNEIPLRPAASSTPLSGYPGPGDGGIIDTPTPLSGAASPYPGPAESGRITDTPVPGAPTSTSSRSVTNTPTLLPSPISTSGETGTPSPSPTITPVEVSTRLTATDPREFNLVSGEFQFVEFFAFWSPISKSMAPVVHRLDNKYEDIVRFVYLDIDDPANSLFTRLMNERLPPVFFLLNGTGEVIREWEGFIPFERFDQEINNTLQSGAN